MKKQDYSDLKDLTILIVENYEYQLEELDSMLGNYFKRCYLAVNGEEGFNAYKTYQPDIILADLAMPVINGLEMSQMIREADDKIPIIMHSMFGNTDILLECIEMNISGYVMKPTNAKVLLNNLLKHSQLIIKDKEIKKQQRLMEIIADEVPAPIMVTNLTQDVLFLNNAAKEILKENTCNNKKCYEILYGHTSKCENYGEKCPNDMAREDFSKPIKHSFRDKNGEISHFEIKTKPLKNKNGEICSFVNTLYDITPFKKENEELEHRANHDILTGLPKRSILYDRIDVAIQRSNRDTKSFAVFFIDLDHFKNVNDTYGHHIGDMLLKEVASRMQSKIRKVDTLSRFGGDEFIMIIESVSNHKSYLKIVKDILHIINQNFHIDSNIVNIQCSIGIDVYTSMSHKTKEILMYNADKAMYIAKKKGKNTFYFFDKEV